MTSTTYAETPRREAAGGGDPLAGALGLFSIALGVAQVTAPRTVANFIGIQDTKRNRDTMLAIGLREIATGIGILGRGAPAGWLQARAGGDIMDLALLSRAYRTERKDGDRLAMAMAAVAGVLALDVLASRRAHHDGGRAGANGREKEAGGRHVARSITVGRPRDEVYAFWRNLENLPRFMKHLESVEVLDERHSRWRAKAPAGRTVEWKAEMLADSPDLIAWRSLPGSRVANSGRVRFTDAAGDRGTEVHLELHYDPPAGKLGVTVAKLFGEEPAQQVADDLRRFKQVLEVGEVIHSDASIHRGMHPAQPPEARQPLRGDVEPATLRERSGEAAARSSNATEPV
jgi:uncharacterized membrane protein